MVLSLGNLGIRPKQIAEQDADPGVILFILQGIDANSPSGSSAAFCLSRQSPTTLTLVVHCGYYSRIAPHTYRLADI